MRWVRAAAEQGHSPAEHTMGIACQYGDAAGGAEEAASWFARAAAAGIASSQYELGVAYVNGDGVKMDRRQGIEWLWLAMRQGHAQAKADLRSLADAGVFEWPDGEEPKISRTTTLLGGVIVGGRGGGWHWGRCERGKSLARLHSPLGPPRAAPGRPSPQSVPPAWSGHLGLRPPPTPALPCAAAPVRSRAPP